MRINGADSLGALPPKAAIRTHLGNLDGVLLKIASWLLQLDAHSLPAQSLTTGTIARELDTSRGAVVRLCKELGYSGFTEFKAAWMREALAERKPDLPEHTTTLPEGARNVVALTLPAMNESLQTLDLQAFEQAVRSLCLAASVVWFGVHGDSAFLAMSGAHKMERSGRRARAVTDVRAFHAVANTMEANDVVVVISQSGRWGFVSEALKPLRRQGCIVISITSQAQSVLARTADIVLLTAARDISLADDALGLRAAQLMLVDMLVLEVAQRSGRVPLQWSEPTYPGDVFD